MDRDNEDGAAMFCMICFHTNASIFQSVQDPDTNTSAGLRGAHLPRLHLFTVHSKLQAQTLTLGSSLAPYLPKTVRQHSRRGLTRLCVYTWAHLLLCALIPCI